jgi:hypothetical protein
MLIKVISADRNKQLANLLPPLTPQISEDIMCSPIHYERIFAINKKWAGRRGV